MNTIQQIKAYMKEKGIKQIQLAEKLGIHKGVISYYMSEKRNPSVERLEQMCEALGVEIIIKEKK